MQTWGVLVATKPLGKTTFVRSFHVNKLLASNIADRTAPEWQGPQLPIRAMAVARFVLEKSATKSGTTRECVELFHSS